MAISQCVTAVDSRGHELLAHGVPAFPLACYHDNLALCPVPWHWHDELEAVYNPHVDFARVYALAHAHALQLLG